MPLNGTAFAARAAAFASYAEGESPLQLTPVAGGSAVPFIHDEDAVELETTEAGGLDRVLMTVMVRTLISTASQYTWGDHTWTVVQVERDYMGGEQWPHRVFLERHAE